MCRWLDAFRVLRLQCHKSDEEDDDDDDDAAIVLVVVLMKSMVFIRQIVERK